MQKLKLSIDLHTDILHTVFKAFHIDFNRQVDNDPIKHLSMSQRQPSIIQT